MTQTQHTCVHFLFNDKIWKWLLKLNLNILVCTRVLFKNSNSSIKFFNTLELLPSVLFPCSVLLVQIRPRVFWGGTNDNAPRNVNQLSRKYILIHV